MAKKMAMTVGQYQRLRQANAANDVYALSEIIGKIGGEGAEALLNIPFPAFVKRVQALLKSVADVDKDNLPECRDEFDLTRVTARQMGDFYKAVRVDEFATMAQVLEAARMNKDNATSLEYAEMDVLEFLGALKAFMDAVKKSASE